MAGSGCTGPGLLLCLLAMALPRYSSRESAPLCQGRGTEAEQLSSPQLGGEEQNLAEAEVPGEPGTKSIPQVP